MVMNKALTYALLAAVTLVPWNATAVNRYSVNKLLPALQLSSGKSVTKLASSGMHLASNFAENMLVKSLLEITQGKNRQALATINELLSKTPNFKLAHLVRGDLLMAQANSLQTFGSTNSPEAVKDLQDEARVRIERYLSEQSRNHKPNLLIAPNAEQKHVVVIDTDKSRLYLYKNENGSLDYVSDYYVTIGKNGLDKQVEGDKRTPIGVYFAKPKLSQALPDFYGAAAYPLNYPNEWDSAHNRKGSGIWLHGTPSNTYSRPPRASDGCVVLTNPDLEAIGPILQAGKTPVIIANNLKWSDNTDTITEKQALDNAMNQWLADWKSQNTAQYLAHYSDNFFSNGINYQQWSEHKYRVQAGKPNITINLSDISMFTYPDAEKKLVVVDFMQDFKSPTLSNTMHKRQYWILENNIWKIIYEGAA